MGKIISFEGLDGVGKSTILKRVQQKLEKDGYSVLVIREPGTTQLSEKIRKLVKSDVPRSSMSEILLFMAARADMINSVLSPNVKHTDVILLDRYIDSTVAYQGYGEKQDVEKIKQLNNMVVGVNQPNLTVYIDVPESEIEARMKTRAKKDRFEIDKQFIKRVRKGYNEIRKSDPDRVKTVTNLNVKEAVDKAYELVVDCIKSKTEHKRKSLAKLSKPLKSESGSFKATIGRIGRDENDNPTLLLTNVKKVGGRKVLADHVWVSYTRELIKAGTLLPNDEITFSATIEPYKHVAKNGTEYDEYGLANVKDVKLTKAIRVKKSTGFERESLDRLTSIKDEKLFKESASRYLRYVTAMIHEHFS